MLQVVSAALRYFDFGFSDELRLAAQRGAELFVFALGLLLGIALLDLQGQLGIIANKVSFSILIAAIFSAAFESASLGAAVLASSKHSRRTMNAGWIEKILKVTAVVLGVASILKVWGIDIGPILTGVGIAGAATALAAQDLFKNLIAGMSNMAEERFAIGDWIRAEGVAEGIVEDVSLRSTAVRQFDMTLVHIPNSALADAPLINVSKMRHRQIRASVKLHCGTTVEQLSQITNSVRNFLSGSIEFVQPPAARQNVHVAGFSDEAIDMLTDVADNLIEDCGIGKAVSVLNTAVYSIAGWSPLASYILWPVCEGKYSVSEPFEPFFLLWKSGCRCSTGLNSMAIVTPSQTPISSWPFRPSKRSYMMAWSAPTSGCMNC